MPTEARSGHQIPWFWSSVGCECWGLNLSPLTKAASALKPLTPFYRPKSIHLRVYVTLATLFFMNELKRQETWLSLSASLSLCSVLCATRRWAVSPGDQSNRDN